MCDQTLRDGEGHKEGGKKEQQQQLQTKDSLSNADCKQSVAKADKNVRTMCIHM